HDVYFGTDRDAVVRSDASDTTGLYKGRQNRTSYTPEGVAMESGPFYWRVDEVANDGRIAKGSVWSFSVADYALIEDFESYNDIPDGEAGSNLVYVAWKDGFDNPSSNGSVMGYVTAGSMERDNVHSGKQSVALQYNNTTAAVSEVVRTFTSPQDWTAHGVKTLSLWFAGIGTNVPGQLYIEVNGTPKNYDGDAGNLALAGWQPWNIDLASIGTNLSAVRSLAIGIRGPGATGTLLLDDIRLYDKARELITPVEPDPNGLVLHYAFEGNTYDSTRTNHGTAFGNPTYVPGKTGQAINLDGLDDYVAIDNLSYASTGLVQVSVCAWIRTSLEDNQIIASFDRSEYWRLQINGEGGGPGQVGWELATDTGIVDYGSRARVDDGQWHHVAGVFDNGTLTVYLDGNPQTPTSGGSTFGTGIPRFGYIGLGSESETFNAEPRTPADFFNGSIDDVRIYDRSLTQEEIAGLGGRISPFDKPLGD
ncbi:MAG: LamG domain-containing protein, partial [Phycisphaerales bacterium]